MFYSICDSSGQFDESRLLSVLAGLGIVPKMMSNGEWMRISNKLRGDRSTDIAINRSSGWCTDFGDGCRTFHISEYLRDAYSVDVGEVKPTSPEKNHTKKEEGEHARQKRVETAGKMWRGSPTFDPGRALSTSGVL